MAWRDARNTLVNGLRSLDVIESPDHVHKTPPPEIGDDNVHISLIPPPRHVERHPNHVRRTTYEQRIGVVRAIGDVEQDVLDGIADSVDDVVEDVNDLLDTIVQLRGNAVSVADPSWEEMTVVEIPEGSGIRFAQMVGTISIEVEKIVTFTP